MSSFCVSKVILDTQRQIGYLRLKTWLPKTVLIWISVSLHHTFRIAHLCLSCIWGGGGGSALYRFASADLSMKRPVIQIALL